MEKVRTIRHLIGRAIRQPNLKCHGRICRPAKTDSEIKRIRNGLTRILVFRRRRVDWSNWPETAHAAHDDLVRLKAIRLAALIHAR